jgi:hypothetical protein
LAGGEAAVSFSVVSSRILSDANKVLAKKAARQQRQLAAQVMQAPVPERSGYVAASQQPAAFQPAAAYHNDKKEYDFVEDAYHPPAGPPPQYREVEKA